RLAMKTMRCGFVSARDTRLIEHRLNLRPYGQLLNDSHLGLAYGDIWTELLLLRGKDDTGRFAVLGSRSKPHDLPRKHRNDVTRRQRQTHGLHCRDECIPLLYFDDRRHAALATGR